jgi:hypothetical protein
MRKNEKIMRKKETLGLGDSLWEGLKQHFLDGRKA